MTFSWQMAEELAAAHMRDLGFSDARRMPDGVDGGIDVSATDAVAQVKYHAAPIGAPQIQQLRGAAHSVRHILFYSSSSFTRSAAAAAETTGVALFRYQDDNTIVAENDIAAALLSGGSRSPAAQAALATLSRARALAIGYLGMATLVSSTVAASAVITPERQRRLLALGVLPADGFEDHTPPQYIKVAERMRSNIDGSIRSVLNDDVSNPVWFAAAARVANAYVESLSIAAVAKFPGVDTQKWACVFTLIYLDDSRDPEDRALLASGFRPEAPLPGSPHDLLAEVHTTLN